MNVILLTQQVQTERTVPKNKPVIIIRDNEKRTCVLIEVAVAGDGNVMKKGAENILKYKSVTIAIQNTRSEKTTVITVIIH
jgi:hypothetical protein